MSIRKKLFLSFLIVVLFNLVAYKVVFEHIIVDQLKTDRHEQFKRERDAAEQVQINQLLRSNHFKDPTEIRELTKALPEDLMYKITVTDSNGNQIFDKVSQAFNPEEAGSKSVSEYHYENESLHTIIRFYTNDSDILASKGMTMIVIYIYGSILLVGLVLIYILARWILRPVNELTRVTQEIKSGKRHISFSYNRNDEFAQLLSSFTDMVEQLRISEERQQEVISAIAHDIRTPLTTIKGYASYISTGRVTDLQMIRRQVSKIEQNAADLDRLLYELQDYTQQSTDIPLTISRIHLRRFMQNIAEDYKVKAKEARLHFQWKFRVSSELYIEADEPKLRRVLENLLNNAIYYNKPKGAILLTCDQRERHLLFSVIDKGEGIAEDELEKIFTKFYRADESRNRNNGGTGLGLSICQSIVSRHHGQMSVSSKLGEGSCFSFTIPFYQPKS